MLHHGSWYASRAFIPSILWFTKTAVEVHKPLPTVIDRVRSTLFYFRIFSFCSVVTASSGTTAQLLHSSSVFHHQFLVQLSPLLWHRMVHGVAPLLISIKKSHARFGFWRLWAWYTSHEQHSRCIVHHFCQPSLATFSSRSTCHPGSHLASILASFAGSTSRLTASWLPQTGPWKHLVFCPALLLLLALNFDFFFFEKSRAASIIQKTG